MRRARVLLVEDQVIVAKGIQLALTDRGFYVQVVHRGREAIGKLIEGRTDALVIDLSLPDIDGFHVVEAVRRSWPDIPVIITSGHDLPPRVEPLLTNGKTAYLQKPFDVDDLAKAIEARLKRSTRNESRATEEDSRVRRG